MKKVTAIMTGHGEGLLAGVSIASFQQATAFARAAGIEVEEIAILDRPDATTKAMFAPDGKWAGRVIETDYGDPGLSRNRGVAEATGDYATFLDADDLWSVNWIRNAFERQQAVGERTILHAEINYVFGDTWQIWVHADSEDPDFDPGYLQIGNYWDALVFTPREIYAKYPFKKNDLRAGYGHEDWHLNCVTYVDGYAHRPVPETVHMKRRRTGSQSAAANDKDVVPWHTVVNEYRWISERRKELAADALKQTA